MDQWYFKGWHEPIEDILKGTWKTIDGTIVEVSVKGYSAMHDQFVYTGLTNDETCIMFGRAMYWDLNGKSLDNPVWNLMKRGTNSYGTMLF